MTQILPATGPVLRADRTWIAGPAPSASAAGVSGFGAAVSSVMGLVLVCRSRR